VVGKERRTARFIPLAVLRHSTIANPFDSIVAAPDHVLILLLLLVSPGPAARRREPLSHAAAQPLSLCSSLSRRSDVALTRWSAPAVNHVAGGALAIMQSQLVPLLPGE